MRPYPREVLPSDPPWLQLAYEEVGVSEIPGPEHNPRVLMYHAVTTLAATDDETPWCSSFCCWVMESQGITSPGSAASLSWLRWGRELTAPVRGCVVIFERTRSDGTLIPGRGHCGFWLGDDGQDTIVLGGNQTNRVGINRMPTKRVIGYRWPSQPHNSTTNIASLATAGGTAVAAAPTLLQVLDKLEANKETVTTVVEDVRGVADMVMKDAQSSMALIGLVAAIAGLVWIVRERNKKMRKWGI